jgi:hypothetical protein
MEAKRFKSLYDWMKQTGELHNFLPRAKGDWDKDKDRFIQIQEAMEKMADVVSIETD